MARDTKRPIRILLGKSTLTFRGWAPSSPSSSNESFRLVDSGFPVFSIRFTCQVKTLNGELILFLVYWINLNLLIAIKSNRLNFQIEKKSTHLREIKWLGSKNAFQPKEFELDDFLSDLISHLFVVFVTDLDALSSSLRNVAGNVRAHPLHLGHASSSFRLRSRHQRPCHTFLCRLPSRINTQR